jgi:hypothetical protein
MTVARKLMRMRVPVMMRTRTDVLKINNVSSGCVYRMTLIENGSSGLLASSCANFTCQKTGFSFTVKT